MTVVELVWWSSTDDFLADFNALFKPTMDHVSAAPGCLKTYYGVEVEDSTNFWMVVVWQSHAHHQAMMDRPDYPAMVARLKPYLRTEQLHMRHVQFNNSHFDARHLADSRLATGFDAPVSAILFLTPRKDMDNVQEEATLTDALGMWSEAMDSASGDDLGAPVVWGTAEEDVNETLLVIGRKDVEMAGKAGTEAGPSSYTKAISELRKVANIQTVHIRLQPGRP